MTTQQKISWYLDKGFAVEVEFENGDKVKLYAQGRSQRFIGIFNGDAGIWNEQELMGGVKVTPIPPNPYEFSVGERVMLDGGEIKTIEKVLSGKDYNYSDKMIYADGWYRTTDNDEYPWYQLAPALPEDEECEVVDVLEWDACPSLQCCKNKADVPIVWSFTKPDGKTLKIKVIKK
jgi:hypothetical protein